MLKQNVKYLKTNVYIIKKKINGRYFEFLDAIRNEEKKLRNLLKI